VSNAGEELFRHEGTAWTAGQLRKALDGIPGDMPLRVVVANEPGADFAGDEQVLISAGPWNDRGTDGLPPDHFEITWEFPSAECYRRRR
jgi:hypothetical protein